MKDLLKELEAKKDYYQNAGRKARNNALYAEANEYMDKALGIADAITIILESEHGYKFV